MQSANESERSAGGGTDGAGETTPLAAETASAGAALQSIDPAAAARLRWYERHITLCASRPPGDTNSNLFCLSDAEMHRLQLEDAGGSRTIAARAACLTRHYHRRCRNRQQNTDGDSAVDARRHSEEDDNAVESSASSLLTSQPSLPVATLLMRALLLPFLTSVLLELSVYAALVAFATLSFAGFSDPNGSSSNSRFFFPDARMDVLHVLPLLTEAARVLVIGSSLSFPTTITTTPSTSSSQRRVKYIRHASAGVAVAVTLVLMVQSIVAFDCGADAGDASDDGTTSASAGRVCDAVLRVAGLTYTHATSHGALWRHAGVCVLLALLRGAQTALYGYRAKQNCRRAEEEEEDECGWGAVITRRERALLVECVLKRRLVLCRRGPVLCLYAAASVALTTALTNHTGPLDKAVAPGLFVVMHVLLVFWYTAAVASSDDGEDCSTPSESETNGVVDDTTTAAVPMISARTAVAATAAPATDASDAPLLRRAASSHPPAPRPHQQHQQQQRHSRVPSSSSRPSSSLFSHSRDPHRVTRSLLVVIQLWCALALAATWLLNASYVGDYLLKRIETTTLPFVARYLIEACARNTNLRSAPIAVDVCTRDVGFPLLRSRGGDVYGRSRVAVTDDGAVTAQLYFWVFSFVAAGWVRRYLQTSPFSFTDDEWRMTSAAVTPNALVGGGSSSRPRSPDGGDYAGGVGDTPRATSISSSSVTQHMPSHNAIVSIESPTSELFALQQLSTRYLLPWFSLGTTPHHCNYMRCAAAVAADVVAPVVQLLSLVSVITGMRVGDPKRPHSFSVFNITIETGVSAISLVQVVWVVLALLPGLAWPASAPNSSGDSSSANQRGAAGSSSFYGQRASPAGGYSGAPRQQDCDWRLTTRAVCVQSLQLFFCFAHGCVLYSYSYLTFIPTIIPRVALPSLDGRSSLTLERFVLGFCKEHTCASGVGCACPRALVEAYEGWIITYALAACACLCLRPYSFSRLFPTVAASTGADVTGSADVVGEGNAVTSTATAGGKHSSLAPPLRLRWTYFACAQWFPLCGYELLAGLLLSSVSAAQHGAAGFFALLCAALLMVGLGRQRFWAACFVGRTRGDSAYASAASASASASASRLRVSLLYWLLAALSLVTCVAALSDHHRLFLSAETCDDADGDGDGGGSSGNDVDGSRRRLTRWLCWAVTGGGESLRGLAALVVALALLQRLPRVCAQTTVITERSAVAPSQRPGGVIPVGVGADEDDAAADAAEDAPLLGSQQPHGSSVSTRLHPSHPPLPDLEVCGVPVASLVACMQAVASQNPQARSLQHVRGDAMLAAAPLLRRYVTGSALLVPSSLTTSAAPAASPASSSSPASPVPPPATGLTSGCPADGEGEGVADAAGGAGAALWVMWAVTGAFYYSIPHALCLLAAGTILLPPSLLSALLLSVGLLEVMLLDSLPLAFFQVWGRRRRDHRESDARTPPAASATAPAAPSHVVVVVNETAEVRPRWSPIHLCHCLLMQLLIGAALLGHLPPVAGWLSRHRSLGRIAGLVEPAAGSSGSISTHSSSSSASSNKDGFRTLDFSAGHVVLCMVLLLAYRVCDDVYYFPCVVQARVLRRAALQRQRQQLCAVADARAHRRRAAAETALQTRERRSVARILSVLCDSEGSAGVQVSDARSGAVSDDGDKARQEAAVGHSSRLYRSIRSSRLARVVVERLGITEADVSDAAAAAAAAAVPAAISQSKPGDDYPLVDQHNNPISNNNNNNRRNRQWEEESAEEAAEEEQAEPTRRGRRTGLLRRLTETVADAVTAGLAACVGLARHVQEALLPYTYPRLEELSGAAAVATAAALSAALRAPRVTGRLAALLRLSGREWLRALTLALFRVPERHSDLIVVVVFTAHFVVTGCVWEGAALCFLLVVVLPFNASAVVATVRGTSTSGARNNSTAAANRRPPSRRVSTLTVRLYRWLCVYVVLGILLKITVSIVLLQYHLHVPSLLRWLLLGTASTASSTPNAWQSPTFLTAPSSALSSSSTIGKHGGNAFFSVGAAAGSVGKGRATTGGVQYWYVMLDCLEFAAIVLHYNNCVRNGTGAAATLLKPAAPRATGGGDANEPHPSSGRVHSPSDTLPSSAAVPPAAESTSHLFWPGPGDERSDGGVDSVAMFFSHNAALSPLSGDSPGASGRRRPPTVASSSPTPAGAPASQLPHQQEGQLQTAAESASSQAPPTSPPPLLPLGIDDSLHYHSSDPDTPGRAASAPGGSRRTSLLRSFWWWARLYLQAVGVLDGPEERCEDDSTRGDGAAPAGGDGDGRLDSSDTHTRPSRSPSSPDSARFPRGGSGGGGTDWYIYYTTADALSLVLLCVFYDPISGGGGATARDSTRSLQETVRRNRLPRGLVALVALGTLHMVWERAVYSRRAGRAKALTHAALCLALTGLYLVWRQTVAARHASYGGLVFAVRAVSLCASAAQIAAGGFSRRRRRRDPFTCRPASAARYAWYSLYRAVPFLHEVRTLLDWVAGPTALTLAQYLRVGELHDTLYWREVEVWAHWGRSPVPAARRLGAPVPAGVKAVQGASLLALMLLALLGPLFYFSGFNPSGSDHVAVGVRVRVDIGDGPAALFSAAARPAERLFAPADIADDDDDAAVRQAAVEVGPHWRTWLARTRPSLQRRGLLDEQEATAQLLAMPRCAGLPWSPTPAATRELLAALRAAVAGNATDAHSPVVVRQTIEIDGGGGSGLSPATSVAPFASHAGASQLSLSSSASSLRWHTASFESAAVDGVPRPASSLEAAEAELLQQRRRDSLGTLFAPSSLSASALPPGAPPKSTLSLTVRRPVSAGVAAALIDAIAGAPRNTTAAEAGGRNNTDETGVTANDDGDDDDDETLHVVEFPEFYFPLLLHRSSEIEPFSAALEGLEYDARRARRARREAREAREAGRGGSGASASASGDNDNDNDDGDDNSGDADAAVDVNEGNYALSPPCRLVLHRPRLRHGTSDTAPAASPQLYWCLECAPLFFTGNIPQPPPPANDTAARARRPVNTGDDSGSDGSDDKEGDDEKYEQYYHRRQREEWACLASNINCSSVNYEERAPPGFPPAPAPGAPPPPPLYWVVVSDRVVEVAVPLLEGMGLVALYTTLVLALGRLLRESLQGGGGGRLARAALQDVADTAPLADAVGALYAARARGDLALEHALYVLVATDLVRDPAALLRLTGRQQDLFRPPAGAGGAGSGSASVVASAPRHTPATAAAASDVGSAGGAAGDDGSHDELSFVIPPDMVERDLLINSL